MPSSSNGEPTPQRLAAIRDGLRLLADHVEPDALQARLDELERNMGEPGFWDDQESAARTSAEHARTSRKLTAFRALQRDVDDLEGLLELAEEDPDLVGELDEQLAGGEERLRALEEERLFSGRYDSGDALVTSTPAPAAPTRRTGRR